MQKNLLQIFKDDILRNGIVRLERVFVESSHDRLDHNTLLTAGHFG